MSSTIAQEGGWVTPKDRDKALLQPVHQAAVLYVLSCRDLFTLTCFAALKIGEGGFLDFSGSEST